MSSFYEPKGKAREYSPYALNLYMECYHGCRYCYAPSAIRKSAETYTRVATPRRDIVRKLENDLKYSVPKEQILLSFIGDPYGPASDDNAVTRDVLEVLLKYKAPVAILTKGGKRCLRDLDLFREFGEHIQVGATLTFKDPELSKEWEPNAADPAERMEVLRTLHDNGVRTFASFEPVISTEQALQLMRDGLDFIDVYKVGKLNHMPEIERRISWDLFLRDTVRILREAGKAFYIKHDLRQAAPAVRLYGN